EYLNITFEDKDSILNGFLESGKIYLNNIAGVSLEFNTNSYNKNLLFEYCRYIYNNAFEYFEPNFKGPLIQLQIQNVVSENDKE
ncbi:hypothetical protein, partial [Clostridium tarantellae]